MRSLGILIVASSLLLGAVPPPARHEGAPRPLSCHRDDPSCARRCATGGDCCVVPDRDGQCTVAIAVLPTPLRLLPVPMPEELERADFTRELVRRPRPPIPPPRG